jgi:hypothetical protein
MASFKVDYEQILLKTKQSTRSSIVVNANNVSEAKNKVLALKSSSLYKAKIISCVKTS